MTLESGGIQAGNSIGELLRAIIVFASRYRYSKDDEEIYKEFMEIANELIPHAVKAASSSEGSKDGKSILADPECFEAILRFYDGICCWEEGSATPVLHIGWARHMVTTCSKFDGKVRACVDFGEGNDGGADGASSDKAHAQERVVNNNYCAPERKAAAALRPRANGNSTGEAEKQLEASVCDSNAKRSSLETILSQQRGGQRRESLSIHTPASAASESEAASQISPASSTFSNGSSSSSSVLSSNNCDIADPSEISAVAVDEPSSSPGKMEVKKYDPVVLPLGRSLLKELSATRE